MPLTVAVDPNGDEAIQLVDSTAKAGYISQHLEPEFIKKLPTLQMPLPEFRNGSFRAFRVEGRSMVPTLHDGSIVVCRYVDRDLEKIKNSYVHVVVNHEGIVVKRVYTNTDAKGTLVLRSDNDEFPDFDIKLRDVQELWVVVAALNFSIPAPRQKPGRQIPSFELDEMRRRVDAMWAEFTQHHHPEE
ncbi:S24 family peptidase [Hymenobacter fodinae]|nr:S24 family peptidase [Hymenobacter fodinae]